MIDPNQWSMTNFHLVTSEKSLNIELSCYIPSQLRLPDNRITNDSLVSIMCSKLPWDYRLNDGAYDKRTV